MSEQFELDLEKVKVYPYVMDRKFYKFQAYNMELFCISTFAPKWVTVDFNGDIFVWEDEPRTSEHHLTSWGKSGFHNKVYVAKLLDRQTGLYKTCPEWKASKQEIICTVEYPK